MHRGFSVFTPMVGVIVITITILLVAAILQDERVVTAGTLQTYQNIRIANIMRDVQGRVSESIRISMFENWVEQTTAEIKTDNCFNDSLANNYDSGLKECKASLLNETKNDIKTIMKDALKGSVISDTIDRMSYDYKDAKITGISISDINNVVGETKFVDCESPEDCNDGRIKVTINFSKLEGKPVATIETNTSTINVYMPPGESTFITDDPVGIYAIKIGEFFGNFTLMDKTWHGAGNSITRTIGPSDRCDYNGEDTPYGAIPLDKNNECRGYGNGSQWYHYKYVFQRREPQNLTEDGGSGYVTTGWKSGFNFSDNGNRPIRLSEKIYELVKGWLDTHITISMSGWENCLDLFSKAHLREVSYNICGDFDCLENYFISGYIRGKKLAYNESGYGYPGYAANLKLNQLVYRKGDPTALASEQYALPGGHAHKDTPSEYINIRGKKNALIDDPSYQSIISQEPDNTILENTTNYFDERFFKDNSYSDGPLEDLVGKIKESSRDYASSMGFYSEEPRYNLTVESWQYYVHKDISGGDNWYCGEFVGWYIPSFAGGSYTATEALDKFGDHAMFFSLPMNFTCNTYTLVAVKEDYKLLRNTEAHPDDINKTVFHAVLERVKTDYSEGTSEVALWKGSGITEFDRRWLRPTIKDISDMQSDMPSEKLSIRHCIYSYKEGTGGNEECYWIGQKPI
ncbi:MAG: hypothetical protein J7L23_03290 [Candidatus Diapherotrites archaeon]|nr:hypothetical protein [Candidatus Diapherotrites archaeon]